MPSRSGHEFNTARILYRQFLFRIVELESLSSKADVAKLLGRFASVLVLFSLIQMFAGLLFTDAKMTAAVRSAATWTVEYQLLSFTLLVAGLFSVLSWEALLPDQRDAFVLGPLPVQPVTLCLAKVIASASAVGLSAFALNCASGLIWPAALASAGFVAVLRSYVAYWLTLLCAVLFLFSAVLVLESAAALILPRPAFLRLSAVLQTILFAAMLGCFFFEPMTHVSWFPPFCFTAVFFQMQGTLPAALSPVAIHGWMLLAVSVSGAIVCSAALYPTLLSRIASTPDLVQRRSSLRRLPGVADSLANAMLLFVGRSFTRNKQQKLIAAFYLGVGSAILLGILGANTEAHTVTLPPRISLRFLVSTIVVMTVAVVGFRATFSFPVSVRANWVFRLHQIQVASAYLSATRRALIFFTVVPVCVVSLICGLISEPVSSSLEHVALLGLYGILLAYMCLYENTKLPYTCSYLPGTAQMPFLFWGSVLLFMPMTDAWTHLEQRLLDSLSGFGALFGLLLLCICLLEWRNRASSAFAEIQFDDLPEDLIVGLGLSGG